MMPVPKEDISVGGASGQRAAPVALRAGCEEAASDIAEPKASHERAPVAVCPAAAVSNRGRSFPLGATVLGDGVNFSVYSRQASRVDLLLFDDAAATHPARVIEMDPRRHRTYHYWHSLSPASVPGRFMRIAPTAPSIPGAVCLSTPPRCSSIPMGAPSSCPTGTLAA
jgi:hypothetical protein